MRADQEAAALAAQLVQEKAQRAAEEAQERAAQEARERAERAALVAAALAEHMRAEEEQRVQLKRQHGAALAVQVRMLCMLQCTQC